MGRGKGRIYAEYGKSIEKPMEGANERDMGMGRINLEDVLMNDKPMGEGNKQDMGMGMETSALVPRTRTGA